MVYKWEKTWKPFVLSSEPVEESKRVAAYVETHNGFVRNCTALLFAPSSAQGSGRTVLQVKTSNIFWSY